MEPDLARGFSSERPLFSFWLGLLAGSVLCDCSFLADFFTCGNQGMKGLEQQAKGTLQTPSCPLRDTTQHTLPVPPPGQELLDQVGWTSCPAHPPAAASQP